jgi:hypothetical protein
MKQYRVAIFASVNVEAENEEQAIGMAQDAVLNGQIKMREFEFEAQEREV